MLKDNHYYDEEGYEQDIAKGGVAIPFPWRLHEMLKVTAEEGIEDIVSWAPHGRAFTVHKSKDFADRVLTRFFSQTKYPSFQRQLNLYGFSRFSHGPDKGAYYHHCFIKGHEQLVRSMQRTKIKGTKVRRTPTEEPNFYDPSWKGHFGTTIPEYLKKNGFLAAKKSVSPPAANKKIVSSTTGVAPMPCLDILPAPQTKSDSLVAVSDEESTSSQSLDSLDLDAALDSDLFMFEGNPFYYGLDISLADLEAVMSHHDYSPAPVAM